MIYRFVSLLALGIGLGSQALAQDCDFTITAADGFTIRSVRVESRWSSLSSLSLPLAANDAYSPANVLPALEQVRNALADQSPEEIGNRGYIGVRFVDACPEVVGPKLLDIRIRPHEIRLDPSNIGSNLLSIPRSNRSSLLKESPKLLRLVNPTFGLDHDRKLGVVEGLSISTDLLTVPDILRGEAQRTSRVQLVADLSGQRSIDNAFYGADGRLKFNIRDLSSLLAKVGLDVGFDAARLPQGEAEYFHNDGSAGATVQLRPAAGPVRTTTIAGGYRRVSQRRFEDSQPPEKQKESIVEGRAVIDAQIWGGFLRTAGWMDFTSPKESPDNYRRFAGMAGYAREFPVSMNQTVGLDVVFGAGGSRGHVPQYAQFRGGNNGADFLYETSDSPFFRSFPAGPLIRSFGLAEAGLPDSLGRQNDGGESYWHSSTTISFPIPPWSYPLIPNETTDLGISLGDLIRRQGLTSARNFLASHYETVEQMDADDAERRADADIRTIQPAVEFLTQDANLYSVKPLFMFDVASLSDRQSESVQRYAVGGGLQVVIVVAKFEVGYLHTVRPQPGDPHGNFTMRLVFQNLF